VNQETLISTMSHARAKTTVMPTALGEAPGFARSFDLIAYTTPAKAAGTTIVTYKSYLWLVNGYFGLSRQFYTLVDIVAGNYPCLAHI